MKPEKDDLRLKIISVLISKLFEVTKKKLVAKDSLAIVPLINEYKYETDQ